MTMMTPSLPNDDAIPPFYVTGGTLPSDAPSYVVRPADDDLFAGLRHGDFCYVLNTRQMGKSSLMIRAAMRLRQETGAHICILDLTAIGQNLTPLQWYGGLLEQVAAQLGDDALEEAAETFWQTAQDIGPLRRFFATLEKIVLPTILKNEESGALSEKRRFSDNAPLSLIIFVDEVDAARSLPFSGDEFFAGIRECYNRRASNPLFARLTFCLLGVAAPADLISDVRMSPFNIGRRIRLTDFTAAEAATLAQGLPNGAAAVARVLYWTGGHPYLTQRLLSALAESAAEGKTEDADALCERLFLTKDARQTDDNLSFVRNRLLHGNGNNGSDLSALLDRYRRIRAGKRIRDDETDPVCVTLQLSGVVKTDARGFLIVRNRIYDRVFDAEWALAHLPGAEIRRQKAAFQRGVWRTAAIAAAAIAAVGTLAYIAVGQAAEARRMERIARERLNQMNSREGVRLLEENDPLAALVPLTDAANSSESDALASLRLAFAQRQAPRLFYSVSCGSPILSAETDSDGARFVTATQDGIARIWDAATGQPLTPEMRHEKAIRHAAFSPDGSKAATASEDGTARIWDSHTGQPLTPPLRYHFDGVARHADWSRDGRILAISGSHGAALWDAATGREISPVWDTDLPKWNSYTPSVMEIRAVAFAPDGKRLAFVANTYLANFAATLTGKMNGTLGKCYDGAAVSYAPDGKRVIIAGSFARDRRGGGGEGACIFDAITGVPVAFLPQEDYGTDARFSPDGKTLATASRDGTARVAETLTGRWITPSLQHGGGVTTVRFSADGRRLVTACQDGTAHVWNAHTGQSLSPLLRHSGPLCAALFVRDGRTILTAGADGMARLWELPASDAVSRLRNKEARPSPPAPLSRPLPYGELMGSGWASPDNRFLLYIPKNSAARPLPPGMDADKGAILWDTRENTTVYLRFRWQDMTYFRFSPSGRFLLTYDRGPRLWDIWTGREFTPPLKTAARILCADFTGDDRFLALGGDDGAAQIWDIAAGKLLIPPILLRGAVRNVAFRPDGRCLATVARDGAVQVWDAQTGEKVTPVLRQQGGVNEAVFTGDGRNLVTSGKTQIRVWNLAP